MNRRRDFLKHTLGATLTFAAAWGLETPAQSQAVAGGPEDSRPNFVWITSEDNSAGWLPFSGHPLSKTPALDGLVAEGFRPRANHELLWRSPKYHRGDGTPRRCS